MSLQNKFTNRLFRRVSGLVIDAISGKVGIKTDDGVYTIGFDDKGEHTVTVDLLDVASFSIPAFATQVELSKVKAGDVVVGDRAILGWVVNKRGASLAIADHNGYVKQYTPPKVSIAGGAGPGGVLVVQSLFSLTGSADGAAGLGASLLPLMMLGGDSPKLDKILPFFLMQAANGGKVEAGGINAILPLLLLKGDDDGEELDPILLMAMSGGLGGAGGAATNPLLLMSLLGKGGDGDIDPMTLLALTGGLGGAGGAAGAINPMLLMALAGKGKGGKGGLFGSSKPVAPKLTPTPFGGVPRLQPSYR